MAVDRRQLLMGGAVVVVLVLAVTLLRPATPAPTAPAQIRPQPARAKSSRADAQAPGPVAPVKLGALTEEREQPGEGKRNPFQFRPKPAPQPVRLDPPIKTPQPTSSDPIKPPTAVGPPPIQLKLIGILTRRNGVKWAVLSDGKLPTPLYGKDGDIIDGRYQIVKIGTESIEMTYTDGRGRTVIRLTGQ